MSWFFIKHLLFSCVGANLNFKKINLGNIPFGILVILCGIIVRFTTTFLVTYSKAYTVKERLFIAICWIPKATVQASLSGLYMKEAKKRELDKFIEYGEFL